MDADQWTLAALLILYLVFAISEAASQLLNKHKTQVVLEGQRERSSFKGLFLPKNVGSLRSTLATGKLLLLFTLSIIIVLSFQKDLLLMVSILIGLFIVNLYFPFLLSMNNPKKTLQLLLPLTRIFNLVLFPLNYLRDLMFDSYRAKSRLQASNGDDDIDEAQHLEAYLGEAEQEGLFEKAEADLVRQVVEFSDTVVKEIMTPRVSMECIENDTSMDDFLKISSGLKFSRYPVIDGKIDNVVGIAHIKALLEHSAGENSKSSIVTEIMKKPYFVPESKKISSLLRDFQSNKTQIAIVVDEYGGTAGLITLEDILEEIVGEIEDEHEVEEIEEIIENKDGTLTCSGNVDVDEIEKILDVELDDRSYETVSGLALNHLKHIPDIGEEFVTEAGIKVEILDADEKSINKLKLTKINKDE